MNTAIADRNSTFSSAPHTLVIVEKPSAAKNIASVLGAAQKRDGYIKGSGYLISWCVGHLLELAAPEAYDKQYANWRYTDLPIVPKTWKHVPAKGKTAQLKILQELMGRADVDSIINACDAGREGELIFRLVYEYAKCKKPIKRLWISSMEDTSIREGFAKLKGGAEYDSLYVAASCRERADWLVGLNCTRLFSVLYGVTLNTGRVQSPTLAMLVKREAEITGFVKTPFYTVEIDCGGFTAASERFDNKTAAENIAATCRTATVAAIKQTEKSAAPPKLYDLTTLQREANRTNGYTAQQTLDYVQSLYEKKLSTYPRTDSRFLAGDMEASVTALVPAFAPDAPCNVAQVINATKVTDHHAIIPTAEAVNVDTAALPSGEREILDMLTNRLICAVGEKHRYLETTVTLEANGTEFKTIGKTVIHDGWKTIAKPIGDDESGEEERVLPELSEGQRFDNVTAAIKEGTTSPPKHYTEDTLLSSMEMAGAEDMPDNTKVNGASGGKNEPEYEHKGLGTPATRAAIIEKLIKSGFVERSKKRLLPTDKGKKLIAILPGTLTSAQLTAEWEHKLGQVERGELDGDNFMDGIAAFTKAIVLDNKAPKPKFISLFPESKKQASAALGRCPRCGSVVREGAKGFFCDNRDCGFKLWKESRFWTAKKRPLTADIVANLLKDGHIALKGLYSEKNGKKYDATVVLDDTGDGFVNFKLEFEYPNNIT